MKNEKDSDTFGLYVPDKGPHSPIKGTLVIEQVRHCVKAISDLWGCSIKFEFVYWYFRHDNAPHCSEPTIEMTFQIYRTDTKEVYDFNGFLELHKFVEREVTHATSEKN